jgi:hypothetical protein
MKRQITILLALALAVAASADQAYIRTKLRVFYVPNPNVATGEVVITPVEYLAGTANADMKNLAENEPFRMLLDWLFGPASNSSQALALQGVVDQLLHLTGKPIAIYLVNDRNQQPTDGPSRNRWGINLSGGYTWPAGKSFGAQSFDATGTREASFFGGSFTMGNWHLTQNGQFLRNGHPNADEICATFCHELTHTEDLADWRTHMPGLQNIYGGTQGGHSFHVAIPNYQAAYLEGIANFSAFRFTTFASNAGALDVSKTIKWFMTNGDLRVEKNSQFGTLYQDIVAAGVQPYTNVGTGNVYGVWHLFDVPAKFRMHDELLVALILHCYAKSVGYRTTMGALAGANLTNYRVSTLPMANLVETLSATATGQTKYLPFALVDYFTSFTAATPQAFKDAIEGALTANLIKLIDEYYASVRAGVKGGLNPAKPDEADIVTIGSRLGINSSPGD